MSAGKKSRFFQQLEALHGPAGTASPVAPPATAVGVPGMVRPSTVRALSEPPHVGATAGLPTARTTRAPTTWASEGKRKMTSEDGAHAGAPSPKMIMFFEGLSKQAMERQEAMQQRFLEAMETREQDRMIREEAWRRQEMARLAREHEILAQERAMAATRNAAVLSFIKKFTGQSIPMPSIAAHPIRSMPPPPPPSSRTNATPIAYATAPPPSSQPPASTQQQKPPTSPPASGPGGGGWAFEAFYRNKALFGSPAGAGGAAADHANAALQDRLEASIAALPIRFMPLPPPSSRTHATPIPYAAAPPPSSQPPASTLRRLLSRPLTMPPAAPQTQQQGLMVHQSTVETSHDASGSGSGGGGGAASLSRWSKAEVHALFQLRSNLGMHRKGSRGPIWQEISAGMRRMGYSRSSTQCMNKWRGMNYYFKKVKDSNKCLEDSNTCYFHLFEALYRKKAALGSPSGTDGAPALPSPAAEHANAAPLHRIEALTVAAPISQRALHPHTLPSPAAEHANAAPLHRIEALTVAAPISQRALHPHTLPAVAKKDGNRHDVGGVSGGTQMQASNGGSVTGNRFSFSDESSMGLLNDLPKLPVRSSTISAGAQVEEFLKGFTEVA